MPPHKKVIQKLSSAFKYLQNDVLWQLRLNRSRIHKAGGSRALIYHGVCMNDPFRFNTLFIKKKTFEKQLQLYKKYFQIVSLDDFYQQNFDPQKLALCLTFDDGFANNYTYVYPLLEKYEVPATFFITAIRKEGYDILWNDVLSIAGRYGASKIQFKGEEFLKNGAGKYVSTASGKILNDLLRAGSFEDKIEMMQQFDTLKKNVERDYWEQLTEEEIKKMSASKWVTIGSHSAYHNDLAQLSGQSLRDDLVQSKNYLETLIGKEIKSIAFPYGSYSKEAIYEAKASGYTQLLATEFLFADDEKEAFLKERFTINPFISPVNQMHANITGHY